MFSSNSFFFIRPGHRRPHLRKVRNLEARRHDPGYQIALAVQFDIVAHNSGIRSEMLLPEAMAEHDNIGPAGLIFFGSKPTAQHGLNSQSREETRCRRARIDLLRLVTARSRE